MIRKWMLGLFCAVVGLGSTFAIRICLSYERRLDQALAELAANTNTVADTNDDELEFVQRTKVDATLAQRSVKHGDQPAHRTTTRVAAKTSAPLSKSESLRQRFVELATERAKRMKDEELGQAVAEITQSLADQDAAAETELQKAAEQLQAVAEKFPGTPAGERANRALEAIRAKPSKAIRPPRTLGDDEELDHDDPFSNSIQ